MDQFEKNPLFFQDTRDHPEHVAKNCLSLPSPSTEKPLAEIDQLRVPSLAPFRPRIYGS